MINSRCLSLAQLQSYNIQTQASAVGPFILSDDNNIGMRPGSQGTRPLGKR